jgi:hypothetical protein
MLHVCPPPKTDQRGVDRQGRRDVGAYARPTTIPDCLVDR